MTHKWLIDTPFAHRGLHGPETGHVENSLSAFQAANSRGHGFELDVLLSQDNKAMVFHDVALKRLTGRSGNIDDFTAEHLSEFNLTGSRDVIPTLDSILRSIDQRYPVLIEIKGDQGRPEDIARAVFEVIRDYAGPVAIMSFFPDITSWFQKQAPQVVRGLVATSITEGNDEDGLLNIYFSPSRQISLVEELNVDFIAYDIKALPNETTQYCREKNIPVLTWTVRSEILRQKASQFTDNSIYELST